MTLTPSEAEETRLFDLLTEVRQDMLFIESRIAGMIYTPKKLRQERLEVFNAELATKREEEMKLMKELRALAASQSQA